MTFLLQKINNLQVHVLYLNIFVYLLFLILTLRGLSLFCKILPIPTLVILCIYFDHHSVSLSLIFRHILLPTCLPGLKSPKHFVGLIQMQCSPSFDWANKTTPLHVGTSYTHDIGFYSKGNVSATHQIA